MTTKDKFYFSYSSLVKLINEPKQFYKEYILGEKETKDHKYLKEGQLFHLFILEPDKFDEKFVLSPTKIPTAYPLDVVNHVFHEGMLNAFDEDGNEMKGYQIQDLQNYEYIILEFMRDKNYYQSLKTDQQRLDKVYTNECISYFDTLRDAFNYKKTIVDVDMVKKATEKANIILKDEECHALLNASNSKEDIRKELELSYDLPNYSFGLKGVIDCVKVDYANETIYITDFKTTSKSLKDWYKDFSESEYMYWLQVMIYKELILSLVPSGSKTAWKLRVNFPVIDKNNNLYVFSVSAKSLYEWEIKTKETIEIAKWHYENEKYNLPYEFYVGKIEL
jgi:hypothetical protein